MFNVDYFYYNTDLDQSAAASVAAYQGLEQEDAELMDRMASGSSAHHGESSSSSNSARLDGSEERQKAKKAWKPKCADKGKR